MGLDQYLEARQYISKRDWSGDEPVDNKEYPIVEAMTQPGVVDPTAGGGITLQYTAIQWRKANAIHRWMEANVTIGELENCRDYPIHGDQLKQLRDDCRAVFDAQREGSDVATVAEERNLLPQPGFFFGSYDMDDWYFEHLDFTVLSINRLEKAGALDPEGDITLIGKDTGNLSFTYRAWW